MIGDLIPLHSPIFRHLRSWYGRQFRAEIEIPAKLKSFAKGRKDRVFFIAIGAGDGKTSDPIYKLVRKHRWAGILIEPVPYLFEKLKQNYQGCDDLIFENVAVSKEDGWHDFWYVLESKDCSLPEWYNQLGSFSKDVILKHRRSLPGLDDMLTKVAVKCVSLSTLLQTSGVKHVNLFLIDTEGYDFEVIKQINFSLLRPEIIMYEHKHLSPDDAAKCAQYLASFGYTVIREGINTLAYK